MNERKCHTINEVVKKTPIKFSKYISDQYSSEIVEKLYEHMRCPRHARCNLLIVLDFIKYLIEKQNFCGDEYDAPLFCRTYYNSTENWANMTIDEIKTRDAIPDICKKELCNIIENQINETFVFDW